MCGRFTQTKSREEVIEELGGIELPALFHGRYNVAPTQTVAAIQQRNPTRAEECVWGFNHPRSAGPIINARSETMATRAMFKHLLFTSRCLIPADGFYEWQGRQPYYFQAEEGRLFAFAGLWHNGRCVIITRAADRNMRGIHDRMPVILLPCQWETWLDPSRKGQSRSTIVNLDCPPSSPPLSMRPVSRRVNQVANDDPACLEEGEVQTDLSLFPSGE